MRLWIILLVLVAASCSKKEPALDDPTKAEAEAETSAEAETVGTAESGGPASEEHFPDPTITPKEEWGEPGLHLVAPGQAPLGKLRRTFEKGLKRTVEVNAALTVGARAGQGVAPMKPTPSVDYVLTLETKRVSPNGSQAEEEFVVDQATVAPMESEPELVGSMEDAIESIRGLRGRYSVDSRGRVDKLEIDVAEDADFGTHQMIATLDQVLRQLNLRLPEEEVGEGAEWTLVETIEQYAVQVDQRSTFKITRIDGSRVEIRTKVEQTAAKQKVTPKGGAQHEFALLTLQSAGTGESSWDLTKLAPESAKSELALKSSLMNRGYDGEFRQMESFRESALTLHAK